MAVEKTRIWPMWTFLTRAQTKFENLTRIREFAAEYYRNILDRGYHLNPCGRGFMLSLKGSKDKYPEIIPILNKQGVHTLMIDVALKNAPCSELTTTEMFSNYMFRDTIEKLIRIGVRELATYDYSKMEGHGRTSKRLFELLTIAHFDYEVSLFNEVGMIKIAVSDLKPMKF